MDSDMTLKLSKYLKPWFIPNAAVLNILAILYYVLPIRLEFYLAVAASVLLVWKFLGGYQHVGLNMIDANDCALILMEKLNIELIKLNWLLNKFTKECFVYTILALALFSLVDNCLSPSISVWLALNLLNLYLSFTKLARRVVKYHLGLYKEYNKYVINIIEPSSPEEDKDGETFQEIFDQLKQL